MRLAVFSHKLCWPSTESPTGYSTDGGFPFQMKAISELFDATTLVVPCGRERAGGRPLIGHNLRVAPLPDPTGSDLSRKLRLPFWFARNMSQLVRRVLAADAVHAPIPGDIGTIGMMLAFVAWKPLFVRYCGNWFVQRTAAERFWRAFMERFAGGRNVMLATGGSSEPPSRRNSAARWIFSTTLTADELRAGAARVRSAASRSARLILVSRQERGKGTDLVIASLPAIFRDFPDATLDVVGGGSALPSLRSQANALGLGDRVRFHGGVEHAAVMTLLREAELFCYPTESEGFPKAVLEALATGLPVVTAPVSVLPHLVGNGAGLLLSATGPEDIAAAVRHCPTDPARYSAMSARAVETARHYSLEAWRDTIGEVLEHSWGPLRADA